MASLCLSIGSTVLTGMLSVSSDLLGIDLGPSGKLFAAIVCLAFSMCLRRRSAYFRSVDAMVDSFDLLESLEALCSESVRCISCAEPQEESVI